MQDNTLSAVEPPVACLLELQRLAGFGQGVLYTPSRNRQSHLYTVSERRSPTSIALKRIFLRCVKLLLSVGMCMCMWGEAS